MGKRGPAPRHHLGEGSISRKGYHRVYRDGRIVMAHRWVWEQANGAVPDGHHIHHIDGDPLNNSLANLACLDAVTHKRIHSGCELRDGEWWKPCKVCDECKRVGVADWYLSREGWPLYGRCRPCHIRIVVKSKQERRRRLRGVQPARAPSESS